MLAVFVAHVVLLVLAATNFTLLNWLLPDKHFTCSLYSISWRGGYGFEYVSNYSVPQMLAYIGAYALGLIMYSFAWKRRWFYLGGVGLSLCVLGLVSFLLELSHVLFAHHWSFIASFPILMLVLWIIWIVMFVSLKKQEHLAGTQQTGTSQS